MKYCLLCILAALLIVSCMAMFPGPRWEPLPDDEIPWGLYCDGNPNITFVPDPPIKGMPLSITGWFNWEQHCYGTWHRYKLEYRFKVGGHWGEWLSTGWVAAGGTKGKFGSPGVTEVPVVPSMAQAVDSYFEVQCQSCGYRGYDGKMENCVDP